MGRTRALVLAPEDLLLHICAHVPLHHGSGAKLVQFLDPCAFVDRLDDRIDWTAKALLVLRRAFPSHEEMAFTYRVPAGSPRILLLYPRRVVDLLRRHGGTIRAVGAGDADARRVLSMEQERAAVVEWMRE